jgi:DNA-binding transcriptional LysR family regulator
MALGASLVGSLAIEFVHKYPRVSLSLITTDGRSSAFSDPVDLLIQPTTKALSDSSLVARKLVDSHYQLVASTALLATLPELSAPEELSGYPVIGWTFPTPSSRWRLEHPTQGSIEVSVQARFTTDNLMLVKEAALAGLGIAQLPEVLCAADVHAGRLQVVLPGWEPPPIAIHALFPSRRVLTPAGRTFLEMLGKAFLVLGRVPA